MRFSPPFSQRVKQHRPLTGPLSLCFLDCRGVRSHTPFGLKGPERPEKWSMAVMPGGIRAGGQAKVEGGELMWEANGGKD